MKTYFFNPWYVVSCCAPPRPSSDDNTVVTYLPARVAKSGSAILESHGNVHFVKIAKLGDYVEYQAGEVLVCRVNEMRALMIFGPQNDPFMAVAREWFIATNTVRPSKRKGEGIVSANVITAVYEDKDWDYLISKAPVGVVSIPTQQPVVTPTAHAPVAPKPTEEPDDFSEILRLLAAEDAPRQPNSGKLDNQPTDPKPAVVTQSLDISDALEMLAQRPAKASVAPPIPKLERGDAELDEAIAELGDIDQPTESVPTYLDEYDYCDLLDRELAARKSAGSKTEPIAQEQAKRAAEQRKKQSKKTGLGLFGKKKNVAIIAATSSMDEDW